jgi:hypothetical protein
MTFTVEKVGPPLLQEEESVIEGECHIYCTIAYHYAVERINDFTMDLSHYYSTRRSNDYTMKRDHHDATK